MKLFEIVNIDNREGKGSVPFNQNVDYMGLRVNMKPSVFLSLAHKLESKPDVSELANEIKQGAGIGAPFLNIQIPEGWSDGDMLMPAKVSGHEGRHRMLAVQEAFGDEPIEVHLFPLGYRKRHMTPEWVDRLQKGMLQERGGKYISGPLFDVLNP